MLHPACEGGMFFIKTFRNEKKNIEKKLFFI